MLRPGWLTSHMSTKKCVAGTTMSRLPSISLREVVGSAEGSEVLSKHVNPPGGGLAIFPPGREGRAPRIQHGAHRTPKSGKLTRSRGAGPRPPPDLPVRSWERRSGRLCDTLSARPASASRCRLHFCLQQSVGAARPPFCVPSAPHLGERRPASGGGLPSLSLSTLSYSRLPETEDVRIKSGGGRGVPWEGGSEEQYYNPF